MKDLLKKWLNGTAIWSEEKKLRQATEQDHFLAEAMEGYDTFPLSDHTAKIERLKGRIRKPQQQEKSTLFSLRKVAAAAAVIGVIGAFFWVQSALEQPAVLSQHIDKVEAPIAPQENTESTISTIKAEEESQATEIFADNTPETKIRAPQKNALPKPVDPPTAELNSSINKPSATNLFDTDEPIADLEMAANQEMVEADIPPTPASVAETPVIVPAPESAPAATKIIVEAEVMESEPAAEVIFSPQTPNIDRRTAAKEKATKKKRATPADTKINYYVGQVQNEDGQPMHDVKIIGLNTPFKTTSKLSGDFILQAGQPLTKIAVSKDGFHTRKIAINQYSDFLNVSLVKKTTTDPANPEMETLAPKPQAGFENFFTYLENNRIYPAGAKAKGIERDVEISFYIDENGTPTKLKVTNPDIYGFDKEAIRLLEEGPKWQPLNSHARYYVPFELE